MNALGLLTGGAVSPINPASYLLGAVPLTPMQGLVVKSLTLPSPDSQTEATGITQSDVLIRGAITAAIADLRANPWLLDYVFRSLSRDSLTSEEYGEFEIAQAKKWFLRTSIPVSMSDRLDSPTFPIITISLRESVEAEATTGDVHYQPNEDTEGEWPILAGPLVAESYDIVTGNLTFKAKDLGDLELVAAMVVIDRVGRIHEVLSVPSENVVAISPGIQADFSKALVKGARPRFVTQLESLSFKETYSIGCHVSGEPVHLTYLHSILVFILLRYKETLIEKRGFERTTIASEEFHVNENFESERVYSRFVSITGFVRQYWPKFAFERIESIGQAILASGPGEAVPLDPDQDMLMLLVRR